MQTRTVNGYEIAGNKYFAIVISKTRPDNNKIFGYEPWERRLIAFVDALCWADPTLKDAKYTCWGEPFHTLEDVSNDSRCAYTLRHLQDRYEALPLTEAASGKII